MSAGSLFTLHQRKPTVTPTPAESFN